MADITSNLIHHYRFDSGAGTAAVDAGSLSQNGTLSGGASWVALGKIGTRIICPCCHPRVTIFKVRDYSPNTCRLVCRDLEFDHFDSPDAYLTAIKYVGPDNPEEWRHWFVDVDGFACMKLPKAKLIDAPDSFNKQDINVNIRTLYGWSDN